ncbi:MAG: aldo/keto reductase [Planctomycetota bacterium]|nr:MAG: aldo/keto reductase [Planctomycetota bacterium]
MSRTPLPGIHLPGLDKPITRLIQGAMMLRSAENGQASAESFELLDTAFAHGMTTFDLAHVYGGGSCDRIFGQWVRSRDLRQQVVMIAKGCHHNQDRKRVTPYDIQADMADSLARTGFDYLDLWCFHRDDPAQPVGPLVETCSAAVAAGRIRAWGMSNWSLPRIREAIAYAEAQQLVGPVVSSPNYSLAEQIDSPWGNDCITISGPSHQADRDWHAASGFPVLAWSSLARGFLAGGLTRDTLEAVRHQYEEHTLRCYVCEANWQRQERAAALAQQYGCSLATICLAFVLNADFPCCALVGARNASEMAANLQALAITLSPAERAWLDLASDQRPW